MGSYGIRFITPIIMLCSLLGCGGGGGSGNAEKNSNSSVTVYQAQVAVSGLMSSGLQMDINGQTIVASADGGYSTTTGFAANTELTARIVSQPSAPTLGCTLENETETISNSNVTFHVQCKALRETVTSFYAPLQNLNKYLPDADAQVVLYVDSADTALFFKSRAVGGDWDSPVDLLAAFDASRVGTAIEKQFASGHLATVSFKDGADWVLALVSIDNRAQYQVTEVVRDISYIDELDIYWGENDQVFAMYIIEGVAWVAHGALGTDLQRTIVSNNYAQGGFYSAQAAFDGSLGFYYYSDQGSGTYLNVGRINSAGEISQQALIPAIGWENNSTQDQEDNTHFVFFNETFHRWMYVAISREGEVLDFQEITPQAAGVAYSSNGLEPQRLGNGDLLVSWWKNTTGQSSELFIAHFNLAQRQWSDPINLQSETGMQYLDDVVLLPTGLLLSGRGYTQLPLSDESEFVVFANMGTDYTFTVIDIGSTQGQQDEETASCIAGNDSGQAMAVWHKRTNDDSAIYAKRLSEGVWGESARVGASTSEFPTINCALNNSGNALVSWARWINPWGSSASSVNTLEYAHHLATADYWSPTIALLSQPYAYFPAYIRTSNQGFILNWTVGELRHSQDVR